MPAEALEAEVRAYIEAARDERDERGHALVVRNGHARERKILLGAGVRESFMDRDLSGRDYVYVWVDGIHTGVRLRGDGRLCCLVMVGARLDGKKELVAIQDGYRESTQSWAELLRDLSRPLQDGRRLGR